MKINPVYAKELKLRSRTSKFAFTIIIYNAILIFIALLGFESVFNVNWNSYIDYSAASRIYFALKPERKTDKSSKVRLAIF